MDIKFNTLVLSSGGFKGFAYIGSLKVLEELDIINGIKTFVGTSVGAFFASLMAAGYTSEELYDFILNFNYDDIKDIKVMNFIKTFGFESGDRVREFVRLLLKRKTKCDNLTFKELYDFNGKELIINSTCVNTGELQYFNYKDTPDMSIALVVHASCAVPFMLSPVKWNNKLYVDGALLDGFPIHLYDKSTTLGIRLKNAKDTFEKFDNILVYAQAVCTALYHELVKFKERYIADYFVAEIFIPNNKTYNMSCTSEDKLEMYNIGYESTKIKLEKMIKKNDDIKSI